MKPKPFGPARAREALKHGSGVLSREEHLFLDTVAYRLGTNDQDTLLRQIRDTTLCDDCKTSGEEHQAMHVGSLNQCCAHYVRAGNTPADWHFECMKEYYNK